MRSCKEIENFVKLLSLQEKEYLISFAKEKIQKSMNLRVYREDTIQIDNVSISENRFKFGLKCPKCGSKKLNKNGITNKRQRYICKHCRKTFDEMSNSPLSSTKLSMNTWFKYCECMLVGGSIRECANIVGVSTPTSFYMRHRILDILNLELSKEKLNGIIQINQYLVEESFKGKKNMSFKRKISREYNYYDSNLTIARRLFRVNYEGKTCIQTAIDKDGHILSRVISRERPSEDDVRKFFKGRLEKNCIFCVPRCNKSFHTRIFNGKIDKVVVSFFTYKDIPTYTVKKVNDYYREFDKWLKPFCGVASKYMNNYLAWFKYLQMCQNKYKFKISMDLFTYFVGIDIKLTQKEIKRRKIDLLY